MAPGLDPFAIQLGSVLVAALVLSAKLEPERDVRGFFAQKFVGRLSLIAFMGLAWVIFALSSAIARTLALG